MSRCAYCLQGWVVACTRRQGTGEVDEMGPCPYCDLGRAHDEKFFYGGFWQHPQHESTHLSPIDFNEQPLSTSENKVRLQQLLMRLSGAVAA